MMKFRILLADPIGPAGRAALEAEPALELVERTGLSGNALVEALAEVDAVIVRSTTVITRESLARTTRLRAIGRAGAGLDNVDVDAATEKGIAVFNTPDANTISAAELTFGLILALARRIPAADRSMKAGAWDRERFMGFELSGKTLGLVGVGRIGTEVASRAHAFGMRVVASDPALEPERARSLGIEAMPFNDVLAAADIVSLHVPLTPATRGMIDDDALARMRPGALLVNAARGGVVEEAALVRALESGRLAGAALDVFEIEPLPPDHPLRSLENVVLTPHIGARTTEAQENVSRHVALAVRDALLLGDIASAANAAALGSRG